MTRFLSQLNWHLIIPTIALVCVLGFGVSRVVHAMSRPDYERAVTAAGPIVPGTLHVVAQGTVPGGDFVAYTVRRPGRPGPSLGYVISSGEGLFGHTSSSSGEAYGPLRHRQPTLLGGAMSGGAFIEYGYLLDPTVVDVSIKVPRGRWVHIPITPQRGFYIVLPNGVRSPLPTRYTRSDGTSVELPG